MNFYESQNPSKLEEAFYALADKLWYKEEKWYSKNYNIDIDNLYKILETDLEESIYKSLRMMELEVTRIPYKMWENSVDELAHIDDNLIRKKREFCYYLSFVE